MIKICPKPCGGLTTGAVLIAIGVIQLLAGIILLRSKHADLLSGPDFLTASTNIGIGCVICTISTVWKSKKASRKNIARRNVMAALLLTVVIVNLTTSAILILGEGNKLLTLYLETEDSYKSASFAGEVLAGAYVTSVCSPIVCIVVAIVSLSGNCFRCQRDDVQLKDSMAEAPYHWSFDPSFAPNMSFIETPTSITDSVSDDVFVEKTDKCLKRKVLLSNIPTPVQISHKGGVQRNNSWIQKRLQFYDGRLTNSRRDSNNGMGTDFSTLSFEELEAPLHRHSTVLKSKSQGNLTALTNKASQTEKNSFPALDRHSKKGRRESRSFMESNHAVGCTPESKAVPCSKGTEGHTPYRILPKNRSLAKLNKETLEELKAKVQQMCIGDFEIDKEDKTLSNRTMRNSKACQKPVERQMISKTDSALDNSARVTDAAQDELQRQNIKIKNESISIDIDQLKRPATLRSSAEPSIQTSSKKDSLYRAKSEAILKLKPDVKATCSSIEDNSISTSAVKMSRKKSATSLKLLKRKRTSTTPERGMDYSDFLVDQDSLIGLSNEDLIERTNRLRSLRKVVAERLKSEAGN